MARLFSMIVVIFALIALIEGQRPPYAGSRPVGYKDRFRPKPTGSSIGGSSINAIDNRFGELDNNLQNISNSTQRPPMGVEIVYGEPADDQSSLSLSQQPNQQQPQLPQQGFDGIADRIGEQDQEQQQQQQQAGSSTNRPFASSTIATSSTLMGLNINNIENSTNDLFTGGPTQSAPVLQSRPIRPSIIPVRQQQTINGHVPYDAHGDVFLVNLLNRRPIDQQPFWFVNYQAIEAHRNG